MCTLGVDWPNPMHILCVYFRRVLQLPCPVHGRVGLWLVALRFYYWCVKIPAKVLLLVYRYIVLLIT